MKAHLFVVLTCLLLAGLGRTAAASPPDPAANAKPVPSVPPYASDHILIKMQPGRTPPPGAKPLFGDWFRLALPTDDAPTAQEQLAAMPGVELVELDYQVSLGPKTVRPPGHRRASAAALSPDLFPNDPFYPLQWNLPQVEAPDAWEMNRGDGVIVAVVDSGVSQGTDLACVKFVDEYNAITDKSGPGAAVDDFGHGTHVAGTIAQCTNNNLGVAGLADNVRLMPVKALDRNGLGYYSDVAQGIDWARTHGAAVINMSLSGPCSGSPWPACSSSIMNDAIEAAAADDIVLVGAAGNYGQSVVGHPANHPDVIAVAAVDFLKRRASYSDRGLALSVSAPGGDLERDDNDDGYEDGVLQQSIEAGVWDYYFMEGTSMAAPHVSGAAAMLRAFAPQADRLQIQQALEVSALDLGAPGFDTDFGFGLIQIDQAFTALAQIAPSPTPSPTPTATSTPTASPTPTATATPSPTPSSTSTPVLLPALWLPLLFHRAPAPTPTVTVTPSPTATPTPPGPCDERIRNGGFEQNSAWLFLPSAHRAGYSTLAARAGERSLQVGRLPPAAGSGTMLGRENLLGERAPDQNGVYSAAYQAFSLPTDADRADLRLWLRPGSEEPGDADWQRIMLLSAISFQPVETLVKTLAYDDAWREMVFDLSDHLGSNLVLYFEVYNNDAGGAGATWMFVDELSVRACENVP